MRHFGHGSPSQIQTAGHHRSRRGARRSVRLRASAARVARLAGRRRTIRRTWTVTDDWPEDVPVTEAEIEVFEAWFGDLFDELFSTRH